MGGPRIRVEGFPRSFLTMGEEGRSVLAGTDERQDTVPQEIKLAEWRVALGGELTKLRERGIYPTISCKNIRMIGFFVVLSCLPASLNG